MSDILRDLLLNGFSIYTKNGKFILKKDSVPSNSTTIDETEFANYELAVEAAESFLKTPQLVEWSVIVRYNRGLGIEYKNFPDVQAASKEQAEIIAKQLLVNCELQILEIKVILKN
jgi:hypothetical protein